jgi:hypothetical protein
MFALLIVPLVAFWAADNQEFLASTTDAPWHFVGVQDRPEGLLPNGAQSLPFKVGDHSYILFKQAPSDAAAERSIAAYPARVQPDEAARKADQVAER